MSRKLHTPKSLSRNHQHAATQPKRWRRLLLLQALGWLSLIPVAHAVDISGTYVLENDNWLTTPLSSLNFTGRQASNLMIADIVDVFSLAPNHNNRALIRTFIRDANVAGRYPWLTPAANAQVVVDGSSGTEQQLSFAANMAGGIHLQSGSSLTLQNSDAGSSSGGALRVENGALTTLCAESNNDHFSFLNNRAANGGAVFVDAHAVAYIENGIVTGNEAHSDAADVRGGAMLNNGMLVITQTSFNDNSANSGVAENIYGGAIYNSGELSLSDSQFSRNLATNGGSESAGGAIYSDGGEIRVFSSTFTDNQALRSGGAIGFVNVGKISLQDVAFSNNSATGANGEGGAIAVRDAILTIDNETPQSFVGNSATQNGGAIYLAHATATLGNTSFYGNRSEKGAAIFLHGSSLTQIVSNGTTTAFAGNQTSGGYESIAFEAEADSAMVYNVNTEARAKLLMLDPMHVYNPLPVIINKTGSGTWELAGQNQLLQSEFSVNAGTLSLLNNGSTTFSELNGVPHSYNAAELYFANEGRFNLSSSATLAINGNNTISGGQQWYEGTLAFNMQNAAIGNPLLTLINPTLHADRLAGSGGVRIHNVNGIQDGIYTLVSSDTINSTTIGELYLEDSTTPYTNRRSLTPGAKFILLQQDANAQQLYLRVANAYGNTTLTWSGNSNNVWDVNNTPNWQGLLGTIAVSRFLPGDEVIFDGSAVGSHDIVIADAGVSVKKMTLDGYYGFSGGIINVGDLVLADNAQLRIAVNSGPTLRVLSSVAPGATGTISVGNGAKLKLSGAVSGTVAVLTTDGGITRFNPADVSMAQAGGEVDYLKLTSFLGDNGKTIYVTGELAWLSQEPGTAHGEFTLTDASDSYTLINVLSDRSPDDPAIMNVAWNGKSLVKSGDGTLIIASDQAYSGTTTVLGGTLQLGNGGTTGTVRNTIHNVATLIFDRSDNLTFNHTIDGRGTLIKRGAGTLTLTNPDNDIGYMRLDAGSVRADNNRQLGIVNNSIEFAGDINSANYAAIMAAKDVFTRIPTENNLAAVARAIYAANNDGSMPSLVVTAGGSLTMMGGGNQALVSGMGNIHLEEGATFTSTRGGKLLVLPEGVLLLSTDSNASFNFNNVDTGSVLLNMGEAMLLNNTHFSNNVRPTAQGTAITIMAGLNWINDSSFSNNLGGSAVYMAEGEALSLNRVSFTNNSVPDTVAQALRAGAALYVKNDVVFLNDVDFINNGLQQSDAAGNPVGGASDGGAIYFDQAGMVTMNNVRFIGNHANNNGGAISFATNTSPDNPVTLIDTLLIGNTADNLGGATALASGNITHRVSAGKTSVYAGNTANGISNSVYFLPLSNAQINPDTEANATLLMLDPIIAADDATASINKTGSGTWKLAGDNQLQKTQLTISEGTLELVKDGSQQFDELFIAGRASNVHNYAATSLNFTSAGSFTLAAGGHLSVRGADTALGINSISGGRQSFAGELVFDLQEAMRSDLDPASSADDYSNPLLSLSADSWGALPGSGNIRVNLSGLSYSETIRYTLIDGGAINTTAEGGKLYLNDSGAAHQNVRSTSPGAAPLLGLNRDPGHRYIQLIISDPGKNTQLTWQRNNGFVWDEGVSHNWTGNIDGIAVDTFLANDDVLFSDDPGFPHNVYVADEGVHAGSVVVAADYSFSGGTINANTVTINNNASLGIVHSQQPALIAGHLDFNGNAHLNITGYNGGERVTLVHTENGISGFDPAAITIGGATTVDYLTGSVSLDNNNQDIVSDLTLTWQAASNAHGTFTLNNSDVFVLGVALRDQAANANWDGKSLTKEGTGMLIIEQPMEYTGRTNINAGMLRLGLGGASGNLSSLSEGVFIDSAGTLAFDWSNDVTYDGLISGDGTVVKYGAGSVTLTNPQSHVQTLILEQGSIRFMRNPGVSPFADQIAFRGDINAADNQLLLGAFNAYQAQPSLGALTVLNVAVEVARRSGNLPTLRIAAGQTFNSNNTRTVFLTGQPGFSGSMHLEGDSQFISYGGDAGLNNGGSLNSADNYMLITADDSASTIISNNQAANGGAIYIDDPVALLKKTLFNSNHASGSGGAVYNGDQLALFDVNFIENKAVAGDGGAIYIADRAVVTQMVSEGVSYYAENIANGLRNSITLGQAATYKVITLQNSQLNMLDPFNAPNDNAHFEKWGLGTWQISDENMVTGANISIDIAQGTLAFARGKTRSISMITGQVLTTTNSSAVLTMDASTTLTVNEEAALLFEGDNLITGGTLILKGELAFDVLDLTEYTTPMLTISSKIDPDLKLGSGIVRIFNTWVIPLSGTANIIPLVHSVSADQIASSGELYLGNDAHPYVAQRHNQPGTALVGLTTSNNGQTLNLIVVDASTSAALTWTGAVNQIWDTNTTRNWNGTVAGISVNTFLFGDDVLFGKQTNDQTIVVADGGVSVNHMDLKAAHHFIGGRISANTVDIDANTAIGLMIGSTPSLTATTVNFGTNSALNITGICNAGQSATVIQTWQPDSINGFDHPQLTIAGMRSVDFMTASASLSADRDAINVATTLTWMSPQRGSAHGTFTLPETSDVFVLGVPLADNRNLATRNPNWDGTTLTKRGDGTLVFTADHTYTGSTTIEAGTLQLGLGGSSGSVQGNIVNNATLRFNRADDFVYSGSISGSAAATIYKEGMGTLTLTGINNFRGNTFVNSGTLAVRGSLYGTVNVAADALLNIYQGTHLGDVVARAANIGFYIPAAITPNTILATADHVNIDKARITIGVDGAANLTDMGLGGLITLLHTNKLNADAISSLNLMIGSTISYDVTLLVEGNSLLANLSSARSQARSESKVLSEAQASGLSTLLLGSDLIADKIFPSLSSATSQSPLQSFGMIEASKQTIETGSEVELHGYNAVAGMALKHDFAAGKKGWLGAFFEYGTADFDTYNEYSGDDLRGSGDNHYIGGGIIARLALPMGSGPHENFIEATVRGGQIKTEFNSSQLTNVAGIAAGYESKTPYLGASFAIGHQHQLDEASTASIYARALWLHQGDESLRLSTGERIEFDSLSSLRAKLGGSYNFKIDKNKTLFAGAAFEWEFESKVKATSNGLPIDEPDSHGASYVGDFGMRWLPTGNDDLTLTFGVQGYAGKRQGVTGSLRLSYAF